MLLEHYRQIQVLNIIYNYACKNFITPVAVVLLQSCHVFINSGIILLEGTIPIHFTLALVLASIIFFTIEHIWLGKAAKMNRAASEFKTLLRNSRNKYVKKAAIACRLTSLDVGSYYKSEQSAIISFYEALRENTLGVLLYRWTVVGFPKI